MRPDADEPQRPGIGLLVDEHQIRSDVAVTEIGPRAAERMVLVAGFQRSIGGKGLYDRRQSFIEVCAVAATGLPPVVTLEPMRPLNRPHAGRRAGFGRPRTAADCRLAPPSWPRWWGRWERAERTVVPFHVQPG